MWSYHHQTWHDVTLAQNLLKALKILMRHHYLMCMTSSSNFRYRSRSKFEILYLLSNLAAILQMSQFEDADFEFDAV